MRGVYLMAILAGSMIELEFLYQFLDIFLATIVVPNMIGLVLMAGQVKDMKDRFLESVRLEAGSGERGAEGSDAQ